MKQYQPVIGLEIHVELKTKSKMFCQCAADYFGKPPNTNTCPVCLGLPGALPVPNAQAVRWTALIGMALNCHINEITKFDRKHYFYPDLVKGYQISQYDEPVAVNGRLDMAIGQKKKTFRIHRVHLEEDTGKLIHHDDKTLVDFNRSGVPLVEIVTEPDFANADDVKRFLEELHTIIRYLQVSDADMEKGTMRMEPNISLRPVTDAASRPPVELPAYKVEVKNINSFRFVKQAIEYEIKRQTGLLESGKQPKQETRGFDSKKQITYTQRSKEEAHDYRYFPEPDIPPLRLDRKTQKQIRDALPELPAAKLECYITRMHLKQTDAFQLTRSHAVAAYFESAIREASGIAPQHIANVIINKRVNLNLPVAEFATKLRRLYAPKTTDTAELEKVIHQVLTDNAKVVNDYRLGKKNAIMFLVGQVMRATKGKAEAKLIIEELKQKLT